MKATLNKILTACLTLFFAAAIALYSNTAVAQNEASTDTTKAVQDNSSSFNDSVQFDDMEPIFYEATEDDAAAAKPAESGTSNLALYGGIIVVLIVVLVVLKKAGKKKPSKE